MAWLFALAALACGVVGGVGVAADEEWGLTASEWFVAGGLGALLAVFLILDQLLGRMFLVQDAEQEL